jgi:hypothetical protein
MIALYTLVLAALRMVAFVVRRRAKALERTFSQPLPRQGNHGRADPYLAARQQFELGRLVCQRDRLEAKHFAWQLRQERVARLVSAVRDWKGRKLPYVAGVLDVALILFLVEQAGMGTVDLSQLFQTASELVSGLSGK